MSSFAICIPTDGVGDGSAVVCPIDKLPARSLVPTGVTRDDVGGLDPLTVSLRDYVDGMAKQRDIGIAGHDLRHVRESTEHQAAHGMVHLLEQDAIHKLASLVAAQRTEDAHTVEVALEAVQRAAGIHAAAHDQQHNAHTEIHQVEKEAIIKATEQMDRRLEGMNEFRNALRDQTTHAMPRELAMSQIDAVRREVLAQLDDLRSTLLTLHSRLDVIQGQARGSNATVGYFFAGAGLLLTIIAVMASLLIR